METIWLNQTRKTGAPTVATIGMFDGVHRGHRLLIRQVTEQAQHHGLTATVVTFDRPPRQVLDPTFRPQLLTTLDEKVAAIGTLGVDRLVVLPFTREMAGLSAQAFMQSVLRERLRVERLVIGYDNRFGRDRAEGFDDYVRHGQAMGLAVERGGVAMMGDGSQAVSSSAVRRLLTEGRVGEAADCLTAPYRLTGHVVTGEHIGHELGFPTANLSPDSADKLIPADGAYAVWAWLGGERLPAMMNIGTRPTFDGQRRTLEVHILKEVGDVYGQAMTVGFVERLRPEQRFDSRAALTAQLRLDREATERILSATDKTRLI